MNRFSLLILPFFLSLVPADASLVLTFDPPSLPNGSRLLESYSESGAIFTGELPRSFAHSDAGLTGLPNDGSAFLAITRLATMFHFVDGREFSLNQVDISEYSIVYASPQTVTLLGFKSDNSFVRFSFVTDGIIDGTGPLHDFQTVVLPSTFSDLQRVEFATAGFSIDNLMVTPVPEPSIALFGLVLTCVPLLWRDRREVCHDVQ